ncbi:MAG: hypothetical protein GC204_14205 [Chloroflexi bacterium]|nr:hypothetical protein [Chloroflexota bacterium]
MGLLKRVTQKGQTGQSLVILAIGFLALLGFVGIVTDVSVLFIRYSTMRRAVDAAAIAAAGQMRRVQDTKLGLAVPIADGQATSVANLNLAARQFIEVYGLNPKSVLVETCRAQNVAYDANGHPLDANGHLLFIDIPDEPPVGHTKTVPNDGTQGTLPGVPTADSATIKKYQQLCTADELKLVRVTAQIDAPTIFLRLLGYPTVTLTESAISQTAVIDVVMILDTAPTMANETTYDDWHNIPGYSEHLDVRYVPPYIPQAAWTDQEVDDGTGTGTTVTRPSAWAYINDNNETTINTQIDPTVAGFTPPTLTSPIQQTTIAFEKTTGGVLQEWVPTHIDATTGLPTSDEGIAQPRELCRVRAYPMTWFQKGVIWAELTLDYQNFLGDGTFGYSQSHPTTPDSTTYNSRFWGGGYTLGFVPMYNSPVCCNDPMGVLDADSNITFDDLICQPFKDARDAAESFLDRLDFLRGDRVGYVLFDRTAVAIDPDGSGPQGSMIETQNNLYTDATNTTLLRKGAVETLRDVAGVQVDSTTYKDVNNDGKWDHVLDGGVPRTYDDLMNGVHIGDMVDAPVSGACPDDKATLDPPVLSPAAQIMPDGSARPYNLLQDVTTIPNWYAAASRWNSYEYQASCSHANIGGALATGSSVLYNEGRREGSVWIMVMLSDGAAGGSNPITRYSPNNTDIHPVQPYAVDPGSGRLQPLPGDGGPVLGGPSGTNGGYGIFGLCPYGTDPATGGTPTQLLTSLNFPFCSDLDPATRHYCGTVALNPDVALDANPTCYQFYDVDDYAHDWADWVGLADLPGSVSGGVTGRVSDQLLPTLFTIGYGINFDVGTLSDCESAYGAGTAALYGCKRGDPAYPAINDASGRQRLRDADYMGEELLRYIADVGDNFQIDSDYWQLNASQAPMTCNGTSSDRIGNCINLTSPNWGARGPCEAAWTDLANPNNRGNTFMPKPPAESCGNYFNAPTSQKLQEVFNEIASRMFTRLSQ